MISSFDKEFVKPGIFDKDLSKALHRAFELRQKGDYVKLIDVAKEDVEEILPKAIDFVHKIEKYLLQYKKD
jgi:uncharacterized protein (UPF0332 family)